MTHKRFKDFKFQVISTDPNARTETLIKGHLLHTDQKNKKKNSNLLGG